MSLDYGIVMPQYGQYGLTLSCLSSLMQVGIDPGRIIVVDNRSSGDCLAETKRGLADRVRIAQEQQPGITAAWNKGWREITCDVVIFLNNDVLATQDFTIPLQTAFENPDVELTGLKRATDRVVSELITRQVFSGPIKPRLIQGWCFAVRRSTLEKHHGFDPKLEMYFSDTDFTLRVQQTAANPNHSVHYIRALSLSHLGHQTLEQEPSRKAWWNRDRLRFEELWSKK